MTTNKPAKYNPLISLARQAKRRTMDMQCDPQWVLDLADECEKLRKIADLYRRLIELGEDFQWENIIRVDISDFPSRADAIDAALQGAQP